MLVGERQHPDLDRGNPGGQIALVVLQQDPDEPLEGAVDYPVNDYWGVFMSVGTDIGEPEPLGQLVVELDSGQLPSSPH